MNPDTPVYMGRPCRVSEMKVGNTFFTVVSVQSDSAKETAYNKVKKLILDGVKASSKNYPNVQN